MKRIDVLVSLTSVVVIIFILLSLVFYHFPYMGHDYSLGISWAYDYYFAWNKFNVFNIIFTPQRCFGVPAWSNPIGVNFSLYHVLSIFFKDIHVIVIYVSIMSSVSYWGTKKFLKNFGVNGAWAIYLSIGWCLQGYITTRAIVGHLPFINLGLWPLYAYLILKKNENTWKNIVSIAIFSLLYAHDFYMANTYLFVMFPLAFCLLLVVMKFNKHEFNFSLVAKRLIIGCFIAGIIILPKVKAMFQFTQNFQRDVRFIPIDVLDAMNYVFMNFLIPLPLDYTKMTGWWYGNWESISYVFPFLFTIIICKSALNFKIYKRLLVSLLLVGLVACLIVSGSYSEILKQVPVFKSFHVNPRWMPIVSLALLFIAIEFFKKANIKVGYTIPLVIITLVIPFVYIDRDYLSVNYLYRSGLDLERNRLNYCYEPIFGYKLELLPIHDLKGNYLDPRCYVSKNKCSNFNLKSELNKNLENYSLKPFQE